MEADSTTIESDCYDFNETIESGRESPLADELLKYEGFYQNVLRSMLKKEEQLRLLSWMKEFNLINSSQTCPRGLPECSMIWKPAKVVDGYQWICSHCKIKVPIRENSFFNFIFCTFSISFKILLAWCQDVDVASVANAFGLRKQIVNKIYDKIERVITCRAPVPLGGPGSVVLVEVYPDTIGDQLQPDSSKSDSTPKQQYKILCLADTTQIPTRYWLHMISGHIAIQTENNNTKIQKVNLRQEVMKVLEEYTAPGGFYVIGGGKDLNTLHEDLNEKGDIEGVVNSSSLLLQANVGMKNFLAHDMWKWPVIVSEGALELPRNKIQTYLSCCCWRREVMKKDVFLSLIRLIAQHDHSKKVPKKK